MIDFNGQAVIVTGAGRGMGRLFALEFARRGAAVVVNDLGGATAGGGVDRSVAESVVDEIRAAGGTAVASCDSVATPEGGEAIVQTAVEAFGRLDAVVSNAGIVNNEAFDKLTIELWRKMLSVHLDGAFNVSLPAYRVMKAKGFGRFVFMSSSAGMFGVPNQAHYGAAKAGIFGLKNIIAIEGAAHGILANNVLPWGVTRMITETHADHPEILELPLFRLMDPELVVPMVVYLASRSCAVSHQDYSAGAGRYARVFTAVGPGWLAEEGDRPTADDIAAKFDQISATEPFYVPLSASDEATEICARRGVSFTAPARES